MAARKKKKWWQWLLAYPTIITGAIGAVPQYTTWAKAYMLNVPWNAVSEAEEQKALWTKNFECSWKEPAQTAKTTVTTSRNERVTITLCPSGDALVSIQPPGAEPQFRWIGFDRFETGPSRTAWLPSLAVRPATAAERLPLFAQAVGPAVICVTRDARGFIVRRLQLADGKCQEQVINPYTGTVVEVRPAACTKC
ncbi:MAG TPA: hypothetical protein VLK35_02510 [Methylomirabilota bacterium]|nr:hypothetical protein [Methylomirabilota bacterium]